MLLSYPTYASECYEQALTQSAMTECAYQDYVKNNERVERAMRTLTNRSTQQEREWLDRAKKAWATFAEAQCQYNTAESVGGTSNKMAKFQCLSNMQDFYVEVLLRQQECIEGDLSCNH